MGHLSMSRGVSSCVRVRASGPMISTWRSAATSQSETPSTIAQYSAVVSPKLVGMNIWL